MDIVTLAAARKGSGGGASKEYVDEKVAALINDTTAAQDKTYSSAKVEEKVAGEEITTTSTTSPISTANGKPRKLAIFGKSEVVDGEINSAGEGYAVVDLGTLDWTYYTASNTPIFYSPLSSINGKSRSANMICPLYISENDFWNEPNNDMKIGASNTDIIISNSQYTSATDFKSAMSGVLLCYELADPTQGNAIAIKTDNGSGIDGTMAVFETGTPLYGVSDTVRDVMTWDGSAGVVTKNCAKVRLADLTWEYRTTATLTYFYTSTASFPSGNIKYKGDYSTTLYNLICSAYPVVKRNAGFINKTLAVDGTSTQVLQIQIKDTDYTTVSNFVASLGDAELVYELATPTTTPLTSTENASLAGLRTFEPQTHAQNNAGAEMMVEAYAGTQNGKAISDMQPTRSPLLTLSASGWTNNTQTVTYEHNTGKRNTIDVEPANIKAWTAAGILATAETASTITFECDTVPTADLSFRITSMEVR